jgi:hypothetical protein
VFFHAQHIRNEGNRRENKDSYQNINSRHGNNPFPVFFYFTKVNVVMNQRLNVIDKNRIYAISRPI